MAKDVVRQILEVKLRGHPIGRHMAYFEMISMSSMLDDQEKIGGIVDYFPVSIIRCIEVFFRNCISDLVDAGHPYDENAAELSKSIKLDYFLMQAVHGKKLTIGDIIAHATSLNNISCINNAMTRITGREFIDDVCTVYDRWDVEVRGASVAPIVSDRKAMLGAIERCFECRHILCHELPNRFSLSWSEVREFVDAVTTFLRASEQVMENIIEPGAPLTQAAMTSAAAERVAAANVKIDDLFERLRARMGKGRFRALGAVQRKWSKFAEAQAAFIADEYKGGSIRPQMFYDVAATLLEERILWIEEKIKTQGDL